MEQDPTKKLPQATQLDIFEQEIKEEKQEEKSDIEKAVEQSAATIPLTEEERDLLDEKSPDDFLRGNF